MTIIIIFTISLLCFSSLFLLLLPNCSADDGNDNGRCTTSSCGDIQNIKCPFFLEGNPHNCSSPRKKQLACENNRTILYISSKKFLVIDISYGSFGTIQVVDTGLQKDNYSSMPLYSMTFYDFHNFYPYNSKAIIYMSCSSPIVDSGKYIDASQFIKLDSNMYSYILMEPATISDLKNSCNIVWMSWMMQNNDTYTSYLDIHDQMMQGFYLWAFSDECGEWRIGLTLDEKLLRLLGMTLYDVEVTTFWVGCFLAGRFILGTAFVVALLIYTVRRRHRALENGMEDFLYLYSNRMPTRYSYSDIKRMTQDFKDKIGQGGYGSVFKGFLRNNRPVAIKFLGTSKGNGQEFINEVATIGRIHHINVVKLIGFVAERSKRALIYEFMPKGSLEKYLFPREGKQTNLLSWERTYEIALGIARGIEYLHRGCEMQILHFDIKPHNILLDENYVPKVSDFGLARSIPIDDSIVSLTNARGTIGYIAPELFYKNIGGVSYKSDVYSFGMLLMEMVGRRKNVNALAENSSQIYFPSWVYDQLDGGDDIEMEDATDEEKEKAKKMILVALWCIQMKPIDRPSMTKVLEMLEGMLGHLQMPPKPFFTVEQNYGNANCTSSISASTS